MQKIELKSKTRDPKNEKPENLRKLGFIPAEIYGKKIANIHVSVSANEFEKVLKKAGESTVVELITVENKKHPVIIHDVQYHFLNSEAIHVDFYEVNLDEKLKTKVSLIFTGESKAVKSLGGVLVKLLNEVEVECLPQDLPHNLEVSISSLNTLTDTVHVRDLNIPPKVKLLTSLDEMVVKVQPPRNVESELTPTVSESEKIAETLAASAPKTEEAGSETDSKKTDSKKKE